jgi:hypothetical protein
MGKVGSRFKLDFRRLILAYNFKAKDASTRLSYFIEGENPPNLTRKIKETSEKYSLLIKRLKSDEM